MTKIQTGKCLKRQIRQYEDRIMCDFKPNRNFYVSIGIGQKRFGKILRDEESPKVTELENLSIFFQCNLQDFIY